MKFPTNWWGVWVWYICKWTVTCLDWEEPWQCESLQGRTALYSQHTSIFYASLKNKQIFPSITPRWPQCSSCSSYKVIAPDFASLHWLFPGAFFSHYLPLTLTSFKALFKCYPLQEIFSNHEFKMAAHSFPSSPLCQFPLSCPKFSFFFCSTYQLPACHRLSLFITSLLCLLFIVGLSSSVPSLRTEFFALLFTDGSK